MELGINYLNVINCHCNYFGKIITCNSDYITIAKKPNEIQSVVCCVCACVIFPHVQTVHRVMWWGSPYL